MNKKEKVKLIKDLVKHYESINKNCDSLNALFNADFDSGFLLSIWSAFDAYTALVQSVVEDRFEWVSWYIYDNKCGKVKVKTVEKLVELIEGA
jgi:hypothetical protein